MLAAILRRCLPTLLLLGGASALLLLTDRTRSARTLPAVAVLQQTSSTVLDDAVAGMLAGLGLSRGKKKARADSIAAHIILTAWMEAHASPRPGDGVAIHEPPQRPGALDG